jgi:hypothetical protein
MKTIRFAALVVVVALFLSAAVVAAREVPGPAVAEPSAAMVSRDSVARLPDGTVLLLVPTGTNQKQLLISRTPRPITMKDFGAPIILFGEGGILSRDNPPHVGLEVTKSEVHVLWGSASGLEWHSTPLPFKADSRWNRRVPPTDGPVELQDLVNDGRTGVHAVYSETLANPPRVRLSVATRDTGQPRAVRIAENTQAIVDARVALQHGSDDGSLQVVWTESGFPPRVMHVTIGVSASGGIITEPRVIHDGTHPSVARAGGRTFVASEQPDGSIRVDWQGPGDVNGTQSLRGRAGLRPVLATDLHGVVWLFAVGKERHGLFYRRLLGSGFGAESECSIVPGAWKMSDGFAVQPFVGSADDGFAILHGQYVGNGEEYRYRFDNLPVPRYSVRDDRHVLFLDLLEVAEIDNLEQSAATAVRSDANPLNLHGPPGSHDSAVAGYATVLRENGKFRMWYNADADAAGRTWAICYAESDDGIRWTKPQLGLFEFNGSRKNNLLFPVEYKTNTPLIIRDAAETDPQRAYKMVFESDHAGDTDVYLSWSKDGIHWQWPPTRLWGHTAGVNQSTRGLFYPWHEPLSSFFRDPLTSHPDYRWKVYGQHVHGGFPHTDGIGQRKMVVVHGALPNAFSPYENESVLDPRSGHEEDQIHGGMVQPFNGLYVSLYQHWWGKDWNVDLRLAVSRDGMHFSRVQPQSAVLPLGAADSWDSGMLCTPNFVFEHAGKLWLYYRGSVGTLATGKAVPGAKDQKFPPVEDWRMLTGLAYLRPDGFAYLSVPALRNLEPATTIDRRPKYEIRPTGRLTTIPFDAAGIGERTLHVNVENLAAGFASVKAQLRDADSAEVIAGYAFGDCDPVSESSLDHRITWKGSSDLAKVKASRVRVEFQLFGTFEQPKLYSFWFAGK